MRKILRPPELVDDAWRYAGEIVADSDPAAQSAAGTIVPLTQFLADPAAHSGPNSQAVGVRVGPADKVEDLAPHLDGIALVAVEFPSIGEGRGYSFARLLRQQYGFKGEIRAVGAAVKRDLLLAMARTGFDAFELAPGQDLKQALEGLSTFTLAYQAAVPVKSVQTPRFAAQG